MSDRRTATIATGVSASYSSSSSGAPRISMSAPSGSQAERPGVCCRGGPLLLAHPATRAMLIAGHGRDAVLHPCPQHRLVHDPRVLAVEHTATHVVHAIFVATQEMLGGHAEITTAAAPARRGTARQIHGDLLVRLAVDLGEKIVMRLGQPGVYLENMQTPTAGLVKELHVERTAVLSTVLHLLSLGMHGLKSSHDCAGAGPRPAGSRWRTLGF